MGLFDYKHTNKKEHKVKEVPEEILQPRPKPVVPPSDNLGDLLNKFDRIINNIRNRFNQDEVKINPIFDSSLISNLNILQDFLKSYFPELPPYVREDGNNSVVSLRALMDARDYLKNEFDYDPNDIISGLDENDKIFYGKFVIKSDGTIWQGEDNVFSPSDLTVGHVMSIDFAKMIVSVYPGIHLPFAYILNKTKDFSNYDRPKPVPSDEFETPEPGESDFDYTRVGDSLVNPIDNPFYNELIIKNPYITDNTPSRFIPSTDMTLDDIFKIAGIRDYEDNLRDFVTSPKFNPDWQAETRGTTACNTKDINYFWLMFLLLIGGGSYSQRPLPGTNSEYATVSTQVNLFPCERKSYNTGHPMMYSAEKKQGLPISLLQIVYQILLPIILFANIPRLGIGIPYGFKLKRWSLSITWKSITVFPGLCIMGWLEHAIFGLQEYISGKIRDMFKCEMEYLTPVSNSEGIGLDFLSSEEPICSSFDRELKMCDNETLNTSLRMKAGFYHCSKKDNCPAYIAATNLYQSNKENVALTEEDIYTEGSAVSAIIDVIDEGESVSFDKRG